MAAGQGHLDVVRFLAGECGADVHTANASGTTAVMKAAAGQHLPVIQYLVIERGADVNATDNKETTVLMQAAVRGHFALVRFLTEHCKADVNATDEDGASILMKAAAGGHTDITRYLAGECKTDVNIRDAGGATVLAKVVAAGHVDTIRCLVRECGVDVNVRDRDGVTLLMKAATAGHLALGRCLATDCGADVDTTDKQGTIALMQVAAKCDTDLIRFLITECGADVNAAGENGTTALMQAATKGDIDIVRCLVEQHGADVNATDKNGVTALMKSTILRHTDVVRYLGERGANIGAINKDGCSALRIAGEHSDQELQRILTQYILVEASNGNEMGAINVVSPDYSITDKLNWSIPPSEIELLNFVKTGNVGGEYRAKWLDADVTLKLYLPGVSSHAGFEDEVRLWHQLRHPNVIKLYGACDATPLPLQFFVGEYASKGSLHDYIMATPLKQQKTWSFLLQAALGLEYLHERGIVHGNLRCSNVLVGSDGLAKLVNFGQIDSNQMIRLNVSSLRWQAPEVLNGNPPSFASDVYSLGMCILEAVTREVPWKNWRIDDIRDVKNRWDPAANGTESWEPRRPHYTLACKLVWSMCCQDLSRRVGLSSVVHDLKRLNWKTCCEPKQYSLTTFEDYKCGEINELWMSVQTCMQNVDNNFYCQGFNELVKVYEHLQKSTHPSSVFERFQTLVRGFREMIMIPTEQARVLQLSASCVTNTSLLAFFRRVRSLWSVLGESPEAARQREACWEKERRKQVEIFVSEASKTYLIVEELKSHEEKLEFLASLKLEIDHPSLKYTAGQVAVLSKAYQDLAQKLGSPTVSRLTPEWFIPWYELIIDKHESLGRGGYGSVFRAKWLDSVVVVKRLIGVDAEHNDSFTSSYASIIPATKPTKRSETMAMFHREVDIWFGISHPHVVRLFGACHVGKPFFVCEYATNGTLVSYLRNYPNELWSKLHEAALGVQYLHARGVVHGDLKGNNIVIGSDKKAKVTDFGLSLNTSDGSDARISGATHWVAPECFNCEDARPTFASDIYSLGMCVVEALRVVEAGEDKMKACLPWGNLDNAAVRYRVKQGALPSQPNTCGARQWGLVQRMCAFEPEKRLKISTVVDELERLAYKHARKPFSTLDPVSMESIPQMVIAIQGLLARLQGRNRSNETVVSLYIALWDQLEQVHHQIENRVDFSSVFRSLVGEAVARTQELESMTGSLVSLAETTLRCYALTRRLEKFVEAYSVTPPCSTPKTSEARISGKRHIIDAAGAPNKKPRG